MKHKKSYLSYLVAAAVTGLVVIPTSVHAAEYTLSDYVVEGDRAQEEVPVDNHTYGNGQVASRTSLGVLGDRANIDTPFSTTGYTAKMIEDKQLTSIDDVVQKDAAVSNATDIMSSKTWTIRGISQSAEDTMFNGMYGAGPIYSDALDNVERVDILKGPAALLNGMTPNGSVGGSVNLVPKRAEDRPTRKITLGVDNGHQWRQAIDLGQRFGDKNKYGIRLNASHLSGSGKLPGEHSNGNNLALGLDVKGNRYRASLDAGYAHQDKRNLRTALRIVDKLPAVPAMNTGFAPEGQYINYTEKYMALKGEYDLSKNWTAYAGFGFRTSQSDNLLGLVSYLNTGGANVNISPTARSSHANTQVLGLKGKFNTGALKHEVNLALNRYNSVASTLGGTRFNYTISDAFNPVWQAYPHSRLSSHQARKSGHTFMSGLALTDVISTPDDKWQFILGGRYQKIASQSYNTTTGRETGGYNSSAWSPALGIVHKFTDRFAMYGNYIEGLQPGIVVPYNDNNVNEGQVFAPYKTKQKEVGFKYDTGKFAAQASFFTVDLPNYGYTRLTTPAGWYRYEQRGTTRNRGMELAFNGQLKPGTNLVSSFMVLDAKIKNTMGAYLGKQSVGRSRFTASVGLEQDIKSLPGLTLSATATYNSKAYINSENTVSVSPWIRWDLGARYQFKAGSTPLTLRADVYNVFNHNHWEAGGYRIYQGKERTLAMSLTAKF